MSPFRNRLRSHLFALALILMVLASIMYMTWVTITIGPDWRHLFWVALGAFGHVAVIRFYRLLREADSERMRKLGGERW
jgi:UPF0716 family protein affecting phage T7 exclusion